jgi:hypothetical protein
MKLLTILGTETLDAAPIRESHMGPDAQHGSQVLGVALVVFTRRVPPVVPERIGQMDVGAEVLEQIGGPVPAIGGLEDHLGSLAGYCHGLAELEGLARDEHTAERLALR